MTSLMMGAAMIALATAAPVDGDKMLGAAYDADGPGAAALVVDDGETLYAGAVGMADIAGGRALGPDTAFRYASISKQFAAAMIVHLVEEGRLSYDDQLVDLLPGMPEAWRGVTLHHLLNHTSGIKSYTSIPAIMAGTGGIGSVTTAELVDMFDDYPLDFQPGTRWEYNNSGYVLLGAIIEEVTGKPWHVAIDEALLAPNGITDVYYLDDETSLPVMARGYTGGTDTLAQSIHMSLPHAAGGLAGTLEGLRAWTMALHGGKIVSPESLARMTAPTRLYSGDTQPYGYGLMLEQVRGRDMIGHGGGIFGFSTFVYYVPEDGLFAAVMANSDGLELTPQMAALKLGAMALGDPYPELVPVAAADAIEAGWEGRYEFADGTIRDFYRDGDTLYMRREGSQPLEVVGDGEGRFFYERSMTYFRIADAGDGAVAHFHSDGSTKGVEGRRIGDAARTAYVTLEPAQAERLMGDYAFEIGTIAFAQAADGTMTALLEGQRPEPVRATGPAQLVAPGVGATFDFEMAGGQAIAVTLRQGGAELRGERID
ncbi:serine hydrolase domain-containing protein [Sphingomicrobium aestuariivivum]|uniref:serine hydrolase domain-containing protein n=1 Tax=Sphingomicrobium aestuariivivum TaxID=1582356 RepID=UPI001FD69BE0|nr:serine hydrolase domain-containing protein [Sphingomicrobium aestuariivivum]MCJ8189787.1 beta-lactamase family protein [Sphingomicrobium aestuariivivum]